jgi:hypothetical protein
MRNTLSLLTIGLGLMLANAPSSVWAQASCPGGRMANGECFNADLAESNRKLVTVMTQPKFSVTAPQWLPYEDRTYSIAQDHHGVSNLFTFPFPPVTQIKP